MKLWQVVICLVIVTLPFLGACSADKPNYSPDEVVTMVKQWQESFVGGSPIEWDRYGARLVGTPLVTNFKLDDWDAEYLGEGKWRVSALAKYYEGLNKQTGECTWYFYEKSNKIEYVGNGE